MANYLYLNVFHNCSKYSSKYFDIEATRNSSLNYTVFLQFSFFFILSYYFQFNVNLFAIYSNDIYID